MNARGRLQRVVERVAAGAGDHQHGVVGTERERLAIDGGIFPAGVVDQASRIDRVEELLIDLVAQIRNRHRDVAVRSRRSDGFAANPSTRA